MQDEGNYLKVKHVQHASSLSIEPHGIRSRLTQWFAQYARNLPWRENPSPYAVLVSELMLQQTQVRTVIPYFERWMTRFPTLQSLAEAEEADVLRLWQGLGYYSRARNLHRLAQTLLRDWQGQLPDDPAQLQSLPGIGRYTAGAIAAFAFDRSVPAVDGNIARVLARLLNLQQPIDRPTGQKILWETAATLLPEGRTGGRNLIGALMELGALVCIPKKPNCSRCPLQADCRAPEPQALPIKAPRAKTILLEESVGWILENGFLLLRAQTGRRARGLWKLPELSVRPNSAPLWETVYPFTHHRITLRVFAAPSVDIFGPGDHWFAIKDVLRNAALPAPHRRALLALLPAPCSS